METDVNRGRWRRRLEEMRGDGWQITRLEWQAAKCAYQGGAERVPLWQRMAAYEGEEDGVLFSASAFHLRTRYDREHFQIVIRDRHLPKRWKARNNDRVRLLCDASAFVEAIRRLDAPASSFALWSRQEDAKHPVEDKTPGRGVCRSS